MCCAGFSTRTFLHRPRCSLRLLHYTYRPLRSNEIRLIDVQPGQTSDPVRCRLRHAPLSPHSSYESLSYCWGLSKPEAELESDEGAIPVTKNLFRALQHLRDRKDSRTLWIDAIAINQGDVEERSLQVGLMKDIFRLSDRTVVWLGDQSHGSDSAIELIRKLAKASQERASQSHWKSHESTKLPPLYDSSWKAFATLIQRPWFHRAWVVQEASVARDIIVVCGNASISWNELVQAVQYAVDLGLFIAYGGSTTYQAMRLFEMRSTFQKNRLPCVHDILLVNRSFLATDARDKVFGLLSLADGQDVKAMGVEPDYRLSAEQLYRHISLELLKSPDLRALSANGVRSHSAFKHLPSWVTDWSVSDPSIPLSSFTTTDHDEKSSHTALIVPEFRASGSSTSSPMIDHGKDLLGLQGIVIDQIETVGVMSHTRYLRHTSHMFELFVQCHDILSQLKDWEYVANIRARYRYPTGESRLDAYWQTLSAGRVPRNLPSARKDPRYKFYVLLRSLRLFVRYLIRWFPRTEKNTWYNRWFYWLFQTAWRLLGLTPAKIQRIGFPPVSRLSNFRRMARTEKSYVVLAPRYTQKGDCIAICKGGKMPLVVRKESEEWVLIGECYVHGVMKGEAWDERKCGLMWFK